MQDDKDRVDPASAGAKPTKIGVYDRPAGAGGAGGIRPLYFVIAVVAAALIIWFALSHRGVAAEAATGTAATAAAVPAAAAVIAAPAPAWRG